MKKLRIKLVVVLLAMVILPTMARSDKPVAIPCSVAVLQAHPVNHAIAQEPVMPLISLAIRIGADPNVTTVQFCGNAARDVQIVQREFFT